MYEIYAELRDKKGITDYRVAKESGVSAADLSNWKRGKYNLKIDKLTKLANYFGVPITVFITEEK